MGKVISATILRHQLSGLLDELENGQTHFIVERNNKPTAVLLNLEKFQEIMQWLELINSLDFLPTGETPLEEEEMLEPWPYPEPSKAASRRSRAQPDSVETMAARLGIRLIK